MSESEIIRANKPHITNSSINTYVAHIKRVRKVSPELREGEVLKYLDTLKPTIANQLISAIVALKPEFAVHVARYRKTAEQLRLDNAQKSTAKQRENWVTVASIKRAVRLMRREINQFGFRDHRLGMAYLTWAIMLEHTMRNDLPSVKIAQTTADYKDGGNFYIVSKGELWMSDFKTKRAFKNRGLLPLKLKLQKSLKMFILKYIRQRKPSDYLISHDNGRPFSKAGFRNLMTSSSERYLGKRVGSTMLRHIVLSEFLKRDPSLKERRAKARSMMQTSLETQMSYQIRDVSG